MFQEDITPLLEALSPLILGTFLVLVRLGSMVYWLPGLASGSVPMRVRSSIVLVFTVVICMGHGGIFVEMPEQPLLIGIMMSREVVIGAAMGMAIRLLLSTMEVAGSLAGISMGLSMNVFVDPASGDPYYVDHNTRNTTWEHPGKAAAEDKRHTRHPTLYNGHGRWTTMYHLLQMKFKPGTMEHHMLMNTGTSFLLEHNPKSDRDAVWSDKNDGYGANWLGLQLMLIRDSFIPEGETELARVARERRLAWIFDCFGGPLGDSYEDSPEDESSLKKWRWANENKLRYFHELSNSYWWGTTGTTRHGHLIRWRPNERTPGQCANYGYPGIQSGVWGAVVRQAARSVNKDIKSTMNAGSYPAYSFDPTVEGTTRRWPSIEALNTKGMEPNASPFNYIPFDQIIAFYGDTNKDEDWDLYCNCKFLGNFWTTLQNQPRFEKN